MGSCSLGKYKWSEDLPTTEIKDNMSSDSIELGINLPSYISCFNVLFLSKAYEAKKTPTH